MKVAVCANGNTLDAPADPRFGRCSYFVVVDTETLDFNAVQNPGALNAQGAGIVAAQAVSSLGVSAVIAGNYGPNAYNALSAAGIRACAGVFGTVQQAVEMFKAGQLQDAASPTVASHFGMGAGFSQGPGMGMGRGGGFGRGRGGR